MIELNSSRIASFFGSFQPETFSEGILVLRRGNVLGVKTLLPFFDGDVVRADVGARPAIAVIRRC